MNTNSIDGQSPVLLGQRCCLILWGVHCDEIATVLLATTLRAAGLRVYLVGISGRQLAGSYGLRLQPDLTPAEALMVVHWANCVIIPCNRNLLARFINDPRLDELLARAAQMSVQFVVNPDLVAPGSEGFPYPLRDARPYPQGAALFEFATALAALLTNF